MLRISCRFFLYLELEAGDALNFADHGQQKPFMICRGSRHIVGCFSTIGIFGSRVITQRSMASSAQREFSHVRHSKSWASAANAWRPGQTTWQQTVLCTRAAATIKELASSAESKFSHAPKCKSWVCLCRAIMLGSFNRQHRSKLCYAHVQLQASTNSHQVLKGSSCMHDNAGAGPASAEQCLGA